MFWRLFVSEKSVNPACSYCPVDHTAGTTHTHTHTDCDGHIPCWLSMMVSTLQSVSGG